MSDNLDGIPDASYPDWMYERVVHCLNGKRAYDAKSGNVVWFASPIGVCQDFLEVWSDTSTVTLYFGHCSAINLPPMLAHAVRYNGVTE